ncbi:Gfo/Idh/MocA family protein [Alkalitalea saponilacus]|uniref:Predicted dehydrogenase n=1 Tax=Alkalitalea saponilacus TaxID=889453 RepID=A0A1T5EDX7_9BACT|nr:Gfo/Idh/MocA family oxidoreductase [Alkalitalea saponilacus]ASB49013.1 oxidoreductase [Alkalitalea saponilacus]SKB82136.1 Predicted dehydrogenase [Alkalitalea saponilacus]
MDKIKIGVLGVSNHLIKRIVLPLSKTKYSCIYAIASRKIEQAQQAAKDFNIPVVHQNYQELIDDAEVDAVYIPLPNHLHAEWTIKAIKAKKPVLCEKPLSMDANEAIMLHNISEESKIPFMEAFMYRFHPMWKHIKDVIATNQIGDINQIHTSFSYNNPSPGNIRNIEEYGGGALMDIGCYAVSVPRFLLGKEPIRVLSMVKRHPEFKTDMHTSGILEFDESRASYYVSTLSEPFQKVDIIGTAGTITIHLPFNTYVDVPAEVSINSSLGSRVVKFPPSDAYGLMFDAFAEALLNNQPMPVETMDAINNMKVIDALKKSAKSNNWTQV